MDRREREAEAASWNRMGSNWIFEGMGSETELAEPQLEFGWRDRNVD